MSFPFASHTRRNLREEVERHVEQNPGACIADLAREMDHDWSTIEYHLRVLQDQGRVREMRSGNRRCFVAAARRAEVTEADLISHARQHVYRALREAGPVTPTRLARRLGRARSGVVRHLQALVEDGLAERVPSGNRVLYRALEAMPVRSRRPPRPPRSPDEPRPGFGHDGEGIQDFGRRSTPPGWR